MLEEINKIATHPLQTRKWGEFREKWGNEVIYTEYGLLTLHKIPLTHYKIGMFIRGGMPTQAMLEALKRVALENKLIFIKLEPNYVIKKDGISCADETKVTKLLKSYGARPGKTLFTPESFWIDLGKSEEELLKSFHPKTRYNIGYAQRKGVSVVEDNSDEAFESFLKLMKETVQRQRFFAHNEKYFRLMWQLLKPAGIARLMLAKHEGEVLTAWILFVWQDFLYYPYGAWSGTKQNLQPNSLMMWEAIGLGKKLGLKTFDLWGREEGKGFTRFKEGFAPTVVQFLGTWDMVINKPIYKLYKGLDFVRWLFLRAKSQFAKPTF